MPKKSLLASKFSQLEVVYKRLEKQNAAIYQREQELSCIKRELAESSGIFQGKQRKVLKEKAEQLSVQIGNMKQYISHIVQEYGYRNVKEFLEEYQTAKLEFNDYQAAAAKWKVENGEINESESILERLKQNKLAVEEREKNREWDCDRNDRGAR